MERGSLNPWEPHPPGAPGSDLPITRPGRGQGATATEKAAWRRAARRRRRARPAHARAAKSGLLSHHLLRWLVGGPWRRVGLYLAVGGEPDLAAVERGLWAAGRQVYLPRRRPLGPGLDFVAAGPEGGGRRRLGCLWEPTGPASPAGLLDVVVLPGLAFALDGARLGQGGGAYDRALAGTRALRVGAAFAADVARQRALPTCRHDLAVSFLATERGVFRAAGVWKARG